MWGREEQEEDRESYVAVKSEQEQKLNIYVVSCMEM